MNKIKLFLVIGALASMCIISVDAQNITGIWITEKSESKVEIFERNGEYSGKIIWIKVPTEKDQKNVGTVILKNFIRKDDKTCEGMIFAPHLNKNLKGTITVKSENEIEVRGHFAFFSGKQFWIREIKNKD
ncbi:MAG: DUF2147 domain-containing protein [Prevotellaceae bacterium]|jgi:uncharacterized protein (DUF2147 family)|nr:DUF2147 domain-containing protein [Prevotellaceae bacterium]